MTPLILLNKKDLLEVVQEAMLPLVQEVQHNRSKLANAQQPGELMSRKEAAAYLKITLVTLNTWTRQGTLHCRRINRRVYYLRNELEKVLH